MFDIGGNLCYYLFNYYLEGFKLKKKFTTKDMVISALLIAVGILIPMIFTGLPFRIVVGPYSATLMAHVPVILAMFISPQVAVFTAVGTTLGFFFTAPLIIAVRAASHIFFAIMGALFIKRGMRAIPLCLTTGAVHSLIEGLVVLIFYLGAFAAPANGYSVFAMVLITIFGTLAHHCVDFIIAYIVGKALGRAKMLPPMPKLI